MCQVIGWLSEIVSASNQDTAGILHCWESTELLKAWDHTVQVEAATSASKLFPNLVSTQVVAHVIPPSEMQDTPNTEDPDAGDLGVPFMQETDAGHEVLLSAEIIDEWAL